MNFFELEAKIDPSIIQVKLQAGKAAVLDIVEVEAAKAIHLG